MIDKIRLRDDWKPRPGTCVPVFRRSGKVREVWECGDAVLLIATDRISAFDVIMPTLIPKKGQILTAISNKWFDFFPQIPNHRRTISLSSFEGFEDVQMISGTTVGQKAEVIPIEFVVRGYVAGSFWKEYQEASHLALNSNHKVPIYDCSVHNIKIPLSLKQCEELPEPIFTPATKAPAGEHDENITFDAAVDICAENMKLSHAAANLLMKALKELSIRIYNEARCYALTKGIIIADTKFEFGRVGDTIMIIDELLTPDSSRFWELKSYDVGRDQDSFDKQILRNYLESLVSEGKWDKTAPGPELPASLVTKILNRYQEVLDRLWPVYN